jgi:hypothetical protein
MKNVNFFNLGAKGTANSGGGNSRVTNHFWRYFASFILLFTLALGNAWGQTFRYYIAISNENATSPSGAVRVFKTSDDEHFTNVTSQFTLNSEYSTSSAGSVYYYPSSKTYTASSGDGAIFRAPRYTKNKTFTINWSNSNLSFNKITFAGVGTNSGTKNITVKNSSTDAGSTVQFPKSTTIDTYECTKDFSQTNGITLVSANDQPAYAITILHAVDHAEITSYNSEMVTTETQQLSGWPSGGTWSIVSGPGSVTSEGVLSASGTGTIVVKYAKDGYGDDTKSVTVSATRSIYWFAAGATDATTAGVAHNATFFTIPTTDRSGQSGNVTLDETEYTLTKRASTTTTQCTFTIPSGTEGALYMAAVSSGSTNHTIRIQKTGDASPTDIGTLTGGSSSWSAISKTGLTAGTYTVTSSGNTRPGMLIMKLSAATPVEYYTVTLNPAGGTIASVPSGWTLTAGQYVKTDIEDGSSVTLLALTKDGYKLNGWKDGENADYTSPVTIDGADLTLTAQWAQTYAVTYVPNNGVLPAETMTDNNAPYKAGDEVTLLANTFTAPENKEFDAWVVTPTAGGDPITVTAGKFTMPAAAVTVTATWKDACAAAPTVSATTLGTTSYTTQVVNCAGISVLGSAGCTISEYGFVYGTTTAPTTSNNKKALEGDYTVAGTAFPATTLTGLAMNTKYYVRAYATNSFGTAYGAEVEFTTLAAQGNVLVVASSASQTSDAITALRDNGFVVTVSAPDNSRDYSGYDLVVLDESLDGKNGVANKEEGDIKGVNIPLLNMKAFFYTLSTRWNWGTPVNGTSGNEIANIPTTYKNAQSHPIFAGLTITDGAIDLIDPAKSGNTLQGVTTSTLVEGKEGYTLATSGAGITFIHELTPAMRGVTDAKYLMIAISGNAKDNLSADGEKLIVNAAKYLVGSTAWVPQYYTVSFNTHGADAIEPLTGNPSITLPTPTNGTGSFLGWFTAATEGTKIGEAGASYTPTADITLHAQWETISTDARLASITFSSDAGTLSPAFDPEVVNYTYTMPYPTASVPTITGATAVNANAKAPVIDAQAAAWGGVAHIHGVAESDATKDYYVTMKIAPKDGVCIIKGNVGNDTFVIDEEASLFAGTADKNNVRENSSTYDTKTGWKFQARPARLGLTLSGDETFQEGDVVEVFVTSVANISGANDKMRIFDANDATSTHVLAQSAEDMIQGANRLVLPATTTKSLYLHRSNGGDYDNFNPFVAYVAVYRAMNPILTAITFNGVSGTVNEAYKTVVVTLPEETTDLAALTIVPTVVRNAAHATTPEAVIGGSWTEGANTYRIMDKDGDYTDYTVTITLQGSAATPSITTQPASQSYCAGSEPTLTVEASVSDGGTLHYAWFKDDSSFGSDAASCVVDGAGTYKVVVTNQKTGKFDASTTSSNAVITLNTPATITTQPSDLLKQIEGADITLSVVASNATGYQWYSCDDTEKTNAAVIPGKIAADYTFAATAGFFYCEVTGACGAVESNVARVTVKRSAGCQYITATSGSEATLVDGTKMYACGSDGKLATGDNFASASANVTGIDASAVGMINKQYFVVKFPVDVEEITVFGYNSSSRNVNNLCYGTSVGTDTKVNTAISTDDYVKTASNDGNERSMTIVFNEAFSKDKYLFIKFNSALEVYRICYTEALSKPVVPTLLNQDLCAGEAIAEIDATSTKTGDGTLSYQWYNADDSENPVAIEGASSAKYTPTTDGKYYVEVANGMIGRVSNKARSNTITITHYAGTAITEELAAQRGNVDDVVTLEVVASGKNLHYAWKECATIDGSYTSVAGAADAASLNVTITEGMSKYYKVVVSSDCGANQESIAKVEQFVPVLLQNVTTSTTWDWTKAASVSQIKLTSSTTPKKDEGFVMANGAATIINNANFESDKLYLEGEYIIRNSKFFQGQTIKFNTTKPGFIQVTFSNTDDKPARELYINGVGTGTCSASATAVHTDWVEVPVGEVSITAYLQDKSEDAAQKYVRISKIEFEHYDHKRTGVIGNLGTICLNYDVPVANRKGATFYDIEGSDNSFVYFIEHTGDLEAGMPYVFQYEETNLLIQYGDEGDGSEKHNNGLYGTLNGIEAGSGAGQGDQVLQGNYMLVQNKVRLCGSGCYLTPNRAYIVRSEVPGQVAPQPAPGRRRLMVGDDHKTPTGLDNITEDAIIRLDGQKRIIDGKLFIIRDGHIYNAQGVRVQ